MQFMLVKGGVPLGDLTLIEADEPPAIDGVDDPESPNFAAAYLPFREGPDPAFNPSIETLGDMQDRVIGGEVVRARSIRPLTAEERAALLTFMLVKAGAPSGQIERFPTRPAIPGAADAGGGKQGWEWLPFREEPAPAFDQAAETLDPPVDEIVAGEVVRSRAARPLTAEEISGRAKAKLSESDGKIARVAEDLFDALIAGNVLDLAALSPQALQWLEDRQALRSQVIAT